MIRFNCSRTSEDRTPVIRDVEISKFAEAVLYDYRPELLSSRGYTEDTYYCPELLDPYDFAEKYLGAVVDVQDIYTESKDDFIAGAAVFNHQKVKVFDKVNMCTTDILVPPNTILLDNRTVNKCHKTFETFTVMHETGHLMMHQEVYRRENSALCMRKKIGMPKGGLKTSEDFREHQANIFAASMLMPPRVFMPYVESIIKRSAKFDDDLMITRTFNDGSGSYWEYRVIRNRISSKFGVSARAAELQLIRYGLLAYPVDDDIREARRRFKMYRSLWA